MANKKTDETCELDDITDSDSYSSKEISRRRFFTIVGAAGIGSVGVGSILHVISVDQANADTPKSEGYLIVDSLRCCGCQNCMMACSLTHHGSTNPSLSRIQIVGDSFQRFPLDMSINQCFQCKEPQCVEVCPTGACFIDEENGNVRSVQPEKCIGCQQCMTACINSLSRVQWNFEEKCSQKCDLCTDTPFWDHETGIEGQRACEAVCPERAIKFVPELPSETGNSGYDVDMMTDTSWPSMLIYAAGSTGMPGSEGSKAK